MASAVRIRYVYETSFFDGRADWTSQQPEGNNPSEQVDSAINHPIVRKIQQAVIRARKAVASSSSSSAGSSNPNIDLTGHSLMDERVSLQQQRSPSISSLQTSMCSSEEADVDGRILLNRSRSLQQTHHLFHHSVDSHHHHHRGFSLHLSPKQRTKISEAVLSPISDKSENETCQMLTTTTTTPTTTTTQVPATSSSAVIQTAVASFEFSSVISNRRRPPQSLFPSIISRPVGGSAAGGFNSSDSGISISANSLVTNDSHEALQPLHKPPLHLSLDNSHVKRGNNFFKTICSWYHGSITRRDAEKRLRPAPAGSFLVRDSMASHDDYFLAARGENGFLHVRICCNLRPGEEEENDPASSQHFTLATLPDRRFVSVAAAVNHCANIGVYSRHLPPVILKYPLTEESV